MKIIPISCTQIDWTTFVKEAKASLGRSITTSLDGANVAPGSLNVFPATLGEFQTPRTNPVNFLRTLESNRTLEHIFVGYLIETDKDGMLDLLKLGKLNVIHAESHPAIQVALASGTLRQWREIIEQGSQPTAYCTSLRQLLNEISRHLLRVGFGDFFSAFKHDQLQDGTYALVRK